MIKQCRICRRILSDADFHKDAKSKDGLRSICKSCAVKSAARFHERLKSKYGGLVDAYYNILRRCYDPRDAFFERYGARGITMCDQWKDDRQKFIDWALSHGYREGLQIDRIDNDKGYSPGNCRFVTPAENQHNTSTTKLTEKDVKMIRANNVSRRKMTQQELADKLGVSQSRISKVARNKSWKE